VVPDDERHETLTVDPAVEAEQRERLARLRADRDAPRVRRLLDDIRRAAVSDQREHNLLYPIRAALAARATLGEVCGALRDVWGESPPPDTF